MHHSRNWFCQNCSSKRLWSYVEPKALSGVNEIFCSGCGSKYAKHLCQRDHLKTRQHIWLKIVESGVPALCPLCGPAYEIAKQIAHSPNANPLAQQVASFVCGGLLLGVVVKVIEDMFFN